MKRVILCVSFCFATTTAYAMDKPPSAERAADHAPFHANVRFGALVRANTQYFQQAETFGYPISRTAGGVIVDVGYELMPHVTLYGAGAYYGHGATREGFGKLMLTSEALLLGLRFAPFHVEDASARAGFELAGYGAGGYYWLRETYSDPLLSATTNIVDAASAGFTVGVEATAHVAAFQFVVGYGYHYAPANISNEIGGTVRAGGHEISVGAGIRL